MRGAQHLSPTQPKRLEPWNVVEKVALSAFVFWVACGMIFTVGHITIETTAAWPLPVWLHQFVDFCLRTGDPILILLAFINTHLHAARQWTGGVARRWGLLIIICAFGIETFGTITGFPFGQYHYTDRFGPMLGVVPFAIPLAWHVVVTNALFLVRAFAPHLSRLAEVATTGVICTLYDFILEPFATTQKHYWIWSEGSVPPLNYIAWLVLSALLVFFFAPTLSSRFSRDPRPALILGLTVAIFIAGELF
jgi:uncharacterized membrane protein